MPILSLDNADTPLETGFDLVIVGAGPAGLTIAHAFRDSSYRVCVLESGGLEPMRQTEAMNAIVSVGERRADPELVRRRCVGGSSTIWTGRCGMFDPIDYQPRPWLDTSGWPIDEDVLRTYGLRAGTLLGLNPTFSAPHARRELIESQGARAWDRSVFSPVLWQYSRREGASTVEAFTADSPDMDNDLSILRHTGRLAPVDFGRAHVPWLRSSGNVFLVTHATVVEIEVTADGTHVSGLEICARDGSRRSIAADRVVLACGGIDNARILLGSRKHHPSGVGNQRDQVGRYLADHTFTELGSFGPGRARELRTRLGVKLSQAGGIMRSHSVGIRLAPGIQQREQLLNSAAHLIEIGSAVNPLTSVANGVRSLRAGGNPLSALREIARGMAHPIDLAGGLKDRLIHRRAALNRPDKTLLGCVIEQRLNANSRVRLSSKQDCFGNAIPEIDWRFSEDEYRTALRFRELLVGELSRLGMEEPSTPDWMAAGFEGWKAALIDLAHPMCTTRMADDPSHGVVDRHCEVHGVGGLFVAGSSVFATPGYMNPTQMIVALALRLADRLADQLAAEHSRAPAGTSPSNPDAPERLRVGIVGAGDRIQRIYGPVFNALAQRIEVVGVASRTLGKAEAAAKKVGGAAFASLDDLVEATKPGLLLVAVSPSENPAVYRKAIKAGVPIFVETPIAWGVGTGRKLVRAARASQAMIGVAEQFPFLPIAQLQAKLVGRGYLGRVNAAVNHFAHYDYHGLARLRSALEPMGKPDRINGHQVHIGSLTKAASQPPIEEDWEDGVVRYDSGEVLLHRYSNAYTDSPLRDERGFEILGTDGAVSDQRMVRSDRVGQVHAFGIVRTEQEGRLLRLSVSTGDGHEVAWDNPYAAFCLTDEQIAVALLLEGMTDAVAFGGSPMYDATDALEDIELLAAIRASASRSGAAVGGKTWPLVEKVRDRLTRLRRRRLRGA